MNFEFRILNLKKARVSSAAGCLILLALLILPALLFPAEEWKQVTEPRQWVFPRDHGSHPDYRTEWWYFTGNLVDTEGRKYGYQLTFFRQGLRFIPAEPHNPWSVRDLYLAHFTITDAANSRFLFTERVSRTGPGLAGAAQDNLKIRLLNWTAVMKGNIISLDASDGNREIHLNLVPHKPPVLNGEAGVSRKGPEKGQASCYVSLTDLETSGTLKIDASSVSVSGKSWYDHEFGSNQLRADQAGWDWFSLHLSDGRDLMIYLIRKTDGTFEPASSGTLVERDGRTRHLKLPEINVEVLGHWKSPVSRAAYPANWRITIPSAGIDITLSPLIADQELVTKESTGVTYWEGAVRGQGLSGKARVTCEGYVELTGYAGSVGGLF